MSNATHAQGPKSIYKCAVVSLKPGHMDWVRDFDFMLNLNCTCTGLCGCLVRVQVTHHHNNNNLFNKPNWNTYNINTLFTSSCSCLNTYVLCTLHVLQLRTCTVPESLWYSCGCKTLTLSTIYWWTVPMMRPEGVVRNPSQEQVVVWGGGKGK